MLRGTGHSASSAAQVDLKMKIAILGTRGVPARYGGFETFAEKLAVGLCQHGFDVTVFCESNEPRKPDLFQGVKLHYVCAPSWGPLQTVLYDVKCLWKARKKFDVVYMLGYGAAPFCVIPRLFGAEVWINPDGMEWARAKWGFLARCYFRLMESTSLYVADRIIADAEAIAAILAKRHGSLRACTVIPYGCNVITTLPPVELLATWNLVRGGYYLVVCRLEPENHVLEILRAFQESNSTKQLLVIGNHQVKSRYVAQLLAINDPRIRMIGTVYDQAKLTSLRYYSFGYMHGHSVGGTNPSLLEAMGCGSLIFAHDNLFNRETLGSCGRYFSNELELTQAIDDAEQGKAELTRLREASRSRADENYRWPDIICRYVELLERSACS